MLKHAAGLSSTRENILKGIGMLLFLGASFVLVAMFARRPERETIEIAPVTLVEVLQNMQRKGTLILDVRDPGAYRYGHIPTAVNIPEDELQSVADAKLKAFKEAPVVIVYCGNASCGSSFYAARSLIDHGIHNVCVYANGWGEWQSCGLPVDR